MRKLSGFLAVSGVVWLGGLLGLDAVDGLFSTMFEPSLITLNAALLYVSIPYTAWLTFPLVVNGYLGDRTRRWAATRS